MVKYKLNVAVTTFLISTLLIMYLINLIEMGDLRSLQGFYESFLFVGYFLFLGVFLYAFPISLLTQYLTNKLPVNRSSIKFISYLFFALVVSIMLAIPLYGFSFFAILVAIIFYIIDELLIRIKVKGIYNLTIFLSYSLFTVAIISTAIRIFSNITN